MQTHIFEFLTKMTGTHSNDAHRKRISDMIQLTLEWWRKTPKIIVGTQVVKNLKDVTSDH